MSHFLRHVSVFALNRINFGFNEITQKELFTHAKQDISNFKQVYKMKSYLVKHCTVVVAVSVRCTKIDLTLKYL